MLPPWVFYSCVYLECYSLLPVKPENVGLKQLTRKIQYVSDKSCFHFKTSKKFSPRNCLKLIAYEIKISLSSGKRAIFSPILGKLHATITFLWLCQCGSALAFQLGSVVCWSGEFSHTHFHALFHTAMCSQGSSTALL